MRKQSLPGSAVRWLEELAQISLGLGGRLRGRLFELTGGVGDTSKVVSDHRPNVDSIAISSSGLELQLTDRALGRFVQSEPRPASNSDGANFSVRAKDDHCFDGCRYVGDLSLGCVLGLHAVDELGRFEAYGARRVPVGHIFDVISRRQCGPSLL